MNHHPAYSIFLDETVIYISNQAFDKHMLSVSVTSEKDVHQFLDHFMKQEKHDADILLIGNKPAQVFDYLKSWFKYVEAAGGIATDENGRMLIIKRFGRWDLPKGKLKKNEQPEAGALREVEEETGVEGLKIEKELPSTFHIYHQNNKIILKRTYWFLMNGSSSKKPKPQTEEQITEAVWMEKEKCISALITSYRSIREILVPCI